MPAQYKVVSADDLQSSHDPFTFQPNPSYPEGVQGRDYQRNKAAQETVRSRALQFNPDIALNPSEMAGEGAPTILPDGVVLAGNERSMHPRIAAELAPDRYTAYVEQLKARAPQFGIDPADIAAVDKPVLVRELTSPADVAAGPERWAAINRMSDEVATKAKSATEEGAARAAKFAQASDALDHFTNTIDPEQTVSAYLGTADGKTFTRKLITDGVITPEEFGRLADKDGTLTGDGREAVRRMMLSAAVRDAGVLHDAPPLAVDRIENAVPAIVTTRGTPFDVSRVVTEALRTMGEARAKKITLDDLGAQGSLLGEAPVRPEALALAKFLENNSKAKVSEAFRRYGALAREAVANAETTDMFGGTGYTPERAFTEAFGLEPFTVGMGGRKRPAAAETYSLFGGENLFGEPATMAESPVGQRQTLSQRVAATVKPEMPGAISAEEMTARRGELGFEKSEAEASATPDQRDMFRVGSGAGGRPTAIPTEPAAGTYAGPPARPLPEAPGIHAASERAIPSAVEVKDAVKRVLNPAARADDAALTAGNIRARNAERARDLVIAETRLREFGRYVGRLSDAEQLAIDNAIEAGNKTGSVTVDAGITEIRRALDTERDRIRALGTGKLENFIENYLPHVWTDPVKAKEVIGSLMSRRPIEGRKSFLKQRTIMTMADGIEAGLTPVSYNPVDLTLVKLAEMRRYRMAQEIIAEDKAAGRLQFVSATEKGPDGWRRIDDPAFTVYGPPEVTIHEAFDKQVRDRLNAVVASFGDLTHERKAKIGGGRWGYAEGPAGKRMVTKFGGDVGVIMHELGHIIDFRHGLWKKLVEPAPRESYTFTKGKRAGETVERAVRQEKATVEARKIIQDELRALADLRDESIYAAGETPSASRKAYVRNKYEKMANAIHAFLYAPDRMREVAPTVYAKLRGVIEADPKLRPMLDIKPSLELESAATAMPIAGLRIMGSYYAPEPVAQVYRNFLSPGLRGNPVYDAYMAVGNTINQLQLGLSAFHAGMTTIEQMVSQNALAVGNLWEGKLGTATRQLLTFPAAPLTQFRKGMKLLGEYRSPGSMGGEFGQMVDALTAAGGRVQMEYHPQYVQRFTKAVRAGDYTTAARAVVPALTEATVKPLMEYVVPRQKLGVFYDLAQRELARLPDGATADQVRAAMGRAWDSVDNRMGQVVYDNLFWNKTFKDLLHASVRSVGWNWGTWRELGGGAGDLAGMARDAATKGRKPGMTPRVEYLLALPITIGILGAITQYLYTGQGPQELKDYFFPRTGTTDPDGNPNRVQLPSYMRDVNAYAHHPWQTITHKVHPLLQVVADMLNNEDFYGNEIRNPHAPIVRQLQQVASYGAQEFVPFAVRNVLEEQKRGDKTVASSIANFVGITPANRSDVRTPAQNLMAEFMRARVPQGATPEEAQRMNERRDAVGQLRQGNAQGVVEQVRKGNMTVQQAKEALHALRYTSLQNRFNRLTLEDAEQVFALASPQERQQLAPFLLRKRMMSIRAGRMAAQP